MNRGQVIEQLGVRWPPSLPQLPGVDERWPKFCPDAADQHPRGQWISRISDRQGQPAARCRFETEAVLR
jgi:hypothetical protein